MVPWHCFPLEAATSVTYSCSEQQSFSEPPTVYGACAGATEEDMVSPHPQGAEPGEGSPGIRLADGGWKGRQGLEW